MGDTNKHSMFETGSNPDFKAEGKRSGFTIDPGPYEAIVKAHVKGTTMGQLLVYIPDWGADTYFENDGSASTAPGDPTNIKNYIPVKYASPFYGVTYGTGDQTLPNDLNTAGQSYGMFMVPPDIGNKVLVTFAGGDIDRGYWFACIYDSSSHHMVPGMARNVSGPDKVLAPDNFLAESYSSTESNWPVNEFSTLEPTAFQADAMTITNRTVHSYQSAMLLRQGLDRDKIRGAISSTSVRESPSNVYGISTPGRKSTKGDQFRGLNNPDIVANRKGGHQFVMDDGAEGDDFNPEGTDQLIRLRTTSGHQILMNDTEDILYIASASGNQWLEFSKGGAINIYGGGGFNLRSQGPICMHSDSAIVMQSPVINMNASGGKSSASAGIMMTTTGSISAKALIGVSLTGDATFSAKGGAVASLTSSGYTSVNGTAMCKVGSTGVTTVTGGETTLSGGIVNINGGLPDALGTVTGVGTAALGLLFLAGPGATNQLQDTVYDDASKVWISVPEKLESACFIVPAHEPWVGDDGISRPELKVPTGKATLVG